MKVIVNRTIDNDFTISSDASLASSSVTVPFPSVVLTLPSGNTTSGAAKLLSLQSAIPTGAVSYSAVSDGGEGLLYSALVPSSNSGCQSNCDQLYVSKIGRLTPIGADTSFAGTGVASPTGTYAVPSTFTGIPSAPTIGWYGNRDHWASAMAGSIYTNSGVTLSQGAINSSSISQIALTSNTLNSFCTSTFTAGVTFQQIVAVSMNSTVPVWRLTCTAPSNSITFANGATNSISLSAAALVTVTDSSTITPVLVLGGLSTGVNGFTFVTSVNPTASGSQASLTGVLVTSAYITASSQNVVARKIIRITPALVVTEESSSYSTQTTLTTNGMMNTSEPVLTLSDNNSGIVYLTRRISATSSMALATIGASGDMTVGQNLTFDSASSTAFPFSFQSISFRGSAQDASSGYLSIVRQNTNPTSRKIALQSIEVATGAVTTGEVVSFSTNGSGLGFVNAAHISATGSLNWYLLSSTSLNAFSQVQWTGIEHVVVNNPSVITNLAIRGLTAPVTGAAPVTAITSDAQYTGTVTWSNSPNTFLSSVSYVATVTLTAAQGYTLTGAGANSFTATGGTATNLMNSGVITVTFPAHTPNSNAEQIVAAEVARVVAIEVAKIELKGVLKDGKPGTLAQYQAADLSPTTEKTVARVNVEVLKLAVADRENIDKIKAIVKVENFIEQVSTPSTQKLVTSGQLVELKLIPADSRSKASVIIALKKAPATSLTSLASVQAVIDAHLASLKAKQDRTAAIKAKIAARNK